VKRTLRLRFPFDYPARAGLHQNILALLSDARLPRVAQDIPLDAWIGYPKNVRQGRRDVYYVDKQAPFETADARVC